MNSANRTTHAVQQGTGAWLRLREGFTLQDFMARTGLPLSSIAAGLAEAESKGLITQHLGRVVPTERGFDFLSDLQALFLPG